MYQYPKTMSLDMAESMRLAIEEAELIYLNDAISLLLTGAQGDKCRRVNSSSTLHEPIIIYCWTAQKFDYS